MIVLLVLMAFSGVVMVAQAQECTSLVNVAVSSFPADGNDWNKTNAAATAILVSTTTTPIMGRIYRITAGNSDVNVRQRVELYEGYGGNILSSSTARKIWSIDIATGTCVAQETFHAPYPLIFKRGLAAKKSSADSTVDISIQYR